MCLDEIIFSCEHAVNTPWLSPVHPPPKKKQPKNLWFRQQCAWYRDNKKNKKIVKKGRNHLFAITVTRIKSIGGLMKVGKAYIKANYSQEYATVPYVIPEFCLCDEINNGVTSLVFGQSDYFRKNGEEISLVFDSGTTIAKWNGEKMRNIFREKMVQEIYQKCWRFFEG
jgi:hypothetical protein